MSKKYHMREREFLNLHADMRAYIIAMVEDTRNIHPCCREHPYRGEIVLKMADCYDDIAFDFDLSTKIERENSLHKIRKIVEVITAFRDALEIEAAAIEERETINCTPERWPQFTDLLPRRNRPSRRGDGRNRR